MNSNYVARKLFKSTIHPTSSLHNLLPLLGNIHLSLDYESPQNFLTSLPEPKNTNHSSHMLSPTIRLHNCFPHCIYCLCVFCFCVCFIQLFSLWLLLSINERDTVHKYPADVQLVSGDMCPGVNAA